MMDFKRKLYKRGSSFETTIPMPILLTLEPKKRYFVVFSYDRKKQRWFIDFERMKK